ncbi:MAG: histidine phosphatase family protein, partial [Planctomycetes bacterium]|nr:histidine phosphatase family protein [Planctomycetota bacterium]
MPPRRLFLIRHGETDAARSGDFAGQRDDPLNATGLEQARKIASRFAHLRWGTVHSSTLSRARQTAQALARATGARVVEHVDLREMDYGDWVGLPPGEIERRWPAEYGRWRGRSADLAIPGGESIAQVRARVERSVRAQCEAQDGDLVIVAHGGSVKVALACLMGWPIETWGRIHLDCTGVVMVTFHDGTAFL